jgi:hypothetical protein
MADLAVTAANVVPASGYVPYDGIAGETITAGQVCYIDDTDSNKVKKADNNAALANAAVVRGIAVNGASAGQPVRLCMGGNINPGGVLTVGVIYVLSATPGGIAPAADLASGMRVSVLGVASTASNLVLNFFNSGATVP